MSTVSASACMPGYRNHVHRQIVYRQWATGAALAAGTHTGTVVDRTVLSDAVRIGTPVGRLYHPGMGSYEYATWTSPRVPLDFPATELIPSWTAATPGDTWLRVELRGETERGNTTTWYDLGWWAEGDHHLSRTSGGEQRDADGSVATDTFVAAEGHGLTCWQLRVTLFRPDGSTDSPALRSVGAMASRIPADTPRPGAPQQAQSVVLDLPRYSQRAHAHGYPQWGRDGDAWCSPTATAMVLAYWHAGPTPADYAWADPACAEPWVDHAARGVYDEGYRGCGNWSFNTAYAGRFGMPGFVTRLRSLAEAEAFIAAGIPLILSLSYAADEIPGLDYRTDGHLLVLAGFTAAGDPVLNDPGAASAAQVRVTVPRAPFETAWLTTSKGVVYVIRPPSVALPPRPAQANW